MALKNFVKLDAGTRFTATLRESTVKALDAYEAYFRKAHSIPAEIEVARGQLVEQMLRAYMSDDKAFVAGYSDAKQLTRA